MSPGNVTMTEIEGVFTTVKIYIVRLGVKKDHEQHMGIVNLERKLLLVYIRMAYMGKVWQWNL